MRLMFLLALVCSAASVMAQAGVDPLAHLRSSHPRIMVLDDDIQRVKDLIQNDEQAGETFAHLRQVADKMLNQPTARHVLIGPRLLAQSRYALNIISTEAGMYRLTGDPRYAQRAKKELLAVCAFDDWNPSHFLDVAEMTNAVGIGYDWIYDQLSADERAAIRAALIDKSFHPALQAYAKKAFWTTTPFNWGQVCAGGLTVGALSIADEEPAICKEILQHTRDTIARPMHTFSPDGGWDEGPGYWIYATQYNVFYLSAVASALGEDQTLLATPGFSITPWFHMWTVGPCGLTFNFADAGEHEEPAAQMFWFSRQFNHPSVAAWERAQNLPRFDIFHLLWFDPRGQWPPQSDLPPLAARYDRVGVAFFRSSWTDRNAWYVGFKGGDNTAGHAHLDLGTFVLDALGQRFAMDLGPDDYNLPGYFGKQRWNYYRTSTAGHNTVGINDENQLPTAKAPIAGFSDDPKHPFTIVDFTQAYPAASTARRGLQMIEQKRVLVQDEFELKQPAKLIWHFHTPAGVTVAPDGKSAEMWRGNTRLRISILQANGRFAAVSAEQAPPQQPNKGVTDLQIRVDPGDLKQRIAVLITAADDEQFDPPKLQPLAEWSAK